MAYEIHHDAGFVTTPPLRCVFCGTVNICVARLYEFQIAPENWLAVNREKT